MSNLRKALKRAVTRSIEDTFKKGKVGKALPQGGFIVDVPGLTGCIYVQLIRTEGATVATALNDGVNRIGGTDVWLQEAAADPKAKTLGVDFVVRGRVVYQDEDDPGTATTAAEDAGSVAPHNHSLGSGLADWVESRRLLAGLVYAGSGLEIVVNPFPYRDPDGLLFLYPGGTLDVTSSVPSTPYTHRWSVAVLDQVTGVLSVIDTTPVTVEDPLAEYTDWLFDLDGFLTDKILLAAFPMRYAMTQVSQINEEWIDLRNFVAGGVYYKPELDTYLTEAPVIGSTAFPAQEVYSEFFELRGDTTYSWLLQRANAMMTATIAHASNALQWLFRKARGSLSSPTALSTGDVLIDFTGQGHDGSTFGDAVSVRFVADGSFTGSSRPGRIEIYTTPSGSTTLTKRVTIYANGTMELAAGDTAHAPLRILPGSAPSSPTQGDIWTQDHKIGVNLSGLNAYPVLGDYTQTTFVSNGSSAAENTYVGASEGAPNYPANFFIVGTALLLDWSGILSLGGTSNTLTFRVKLGSTTVVTLTFTGSANNMPFFIRAMLTCVATGASSTIRARGFLIVNGTAINSATTGLFNVNTANAQQFNCTIQCSSATGTVSTDQAVIQCVK